MLVKIANGDGVSAEVLGDSSSGVYFYLGLNLMQLASASSIEVYRKPSAS